jgi:hypothetical protein
LALGPSMSTLTLCPTHCAADGRMSVSPSSPVVLWYGQALHSSGPHQLSTNWSFLTYKAVSHFLIYPRNL